MMYALIDCNNFYASCERVFNPTLNHKPVVVLSNNDGCAIARSNEAKDLGIPMGAPAFQFKEVFQKNKVEIFSTNFALYGDMSWRVMTILSNYTPEMEVYSIDEIFLKFNGFENYNLKEYGLKMKADVLKKTLIPVSVGFGPNKTLAKVANRIAKKFSQELDGVYSIDSDEKKIKALKWLKIGDVWGVGRQHRTRLENIGVKTAFDFTQLPDSFIQTEMSIVGLRMKKELLGLECLELEAIQKKKNIATTRSFDKNFIKKSELNERISTFSSRCAEKLRNQQSYCQQITVFIRTNFFNQHKPQYNNSITIDLPEPTNSSITLSKTASYALNLIYREGYEYKKAGVILGKISPEPFKQLNLFYKEDEKHKALMKTLDKLNRSLPNPVVKLGSQDFGRREKMKQERLSPRYTTNWNELLEIE